MTRLTRALLAFVTCVGALPAPGVAGGFAEGRRPVPQGHPRLLGPRERLQRLAEERPDAYGRVVEIARRQEADEYSKIVSMSLVAAIEKDRELGRRAVESVLAFVTGPIKKGHVPFGRDLALCALAYDLCFESWSDGERERFHGYMNAAVDASVRSFPRGAARVADGEITLTIGDRRLGFKETSVGGWIESAGEVRPFSKRTE